jgi:hypothetical protein
VCREQEALKIFGHDRDYTPLVGWAFNGVLNELHQIVFKGLPRGTAPFELIHLERDTLDVVIKLADGSRWKSHGNRYRSGCLN